MGSAKAKAMLLHVYKYYDKNGDGMVSKAELKEAIQETGLTMEYFMKADTDKDGLISKDEFLNFFEPIPDQEIDMMKEWLLTKQTDKATAMLLDIYAKYDLNGDNSLSLAELQKGIQGTGLNIEYLMSGDKDGNYRISKEEWL